MSQQVFDSTVVSLKMKEHVVEFSKSLSTGVDLSRVFERVEDKVDYSASSFDFSRVNDTVYLLSRSRRVLVSHFPDIKYSGCEIYLKNGYTRYPLSHLEIHADASGKIVKDLPLSEIRQAVDMISAKKFLLTDQVQAICRKSGMPMAKISHARLVIDLISASAVWQLTGEPDVKTNQQDILEMDALSGRIISQQKMPMNLRGAVIQH